jgi:hypothetical protein
MNIQMAVFSMAVGLQLVKNYVIGRVKRGVKALGEVLSKGHGMNLHAISIYALLGYNSFARMMTSVFEQEVGEDSTEDFLLMLTHARKHASDLEHQRNNQDERHWFQKLVDN